MAQQIIKALEIDVTHTAMNWRFSSAVDRTPIEEPPAMPTYSLCLLAVAAIVQRTELSDSNQPEGDG